MVVRIFFNAIFLFLYSLSKPARSIQTYINFHRICFRNYLSIVAGKEAEAAVKHIEDKFNDILKEQLTHRFDEQLTILFITVAVK